MEWVEGLLINQFVSQNLSDNNILSELQKKLVSISRDLEKKQIGHGDLQCGNIIVKGTPTSFEVKLIDYDGMYVPELIQKKSIEKGRSEFQHPKRTNYDFNSTMDRFSFWVIITALESLKFDKTLWREVMQGGFNTLDNFLFTIQDFTNPYQSLLFNRLQKINAPSLNFYLGTLQRLCNSEITEIQKPELFQEQAPINSIPIEHQKYIPNTKANYTTDKLISEGIYKISSNDSSAIVLTTTLKKIGTTPLELEKSLYEGTVLIISNGKEAKRIMLNSTQNLIEIKFDW